MTVMMTMYLKEVLLSVPWREMSTAVAELVNTSKMLAFISFYDIASRFFMAHGGIPCSPCLPGSNSTWPCVYC